MHAFLIVGNHPTSQMLRGVNDLATKLKAKILEFPIKKIEDTRNLNNLTRLKFNESTLIVCPDINEATEEALNAFLKDLEEPQENIFFALTAPSVRKVLPTIVSRCEIVRITNEELRIEGGKIKEFLAMKVGEKLNYIDKIKDREKAIELVVNTVNLLHSQLHLGDVKYTQLAKSIEETTKTLSRLKANGNVNLQLTNFVINL